MHRSHTHTHIVTDAFSPFALKWYFVVNKTLQILLFNNNLTRIILCAWCTCLVSRRFFCEFECVTLGPITSSSERIKIALKQTFF